MTKQHQNNLINWFISARPLTSNNQISTENDIVKNSLIFGYFQKDKQAIAIEQSMWIEQVNLSHYTDILFYLHGFNNPPYSKVLKRVENIQQQLYSTGAKQVQVIPVFWPTQKDLMPANNYFQDQLWADKTALLLQQYLQPLLANITSANIHFIAHSMGARVLLGSLQHQPYPHLKQLFLIAADIENEALEVGQEGEILSESFDHITVYYAKDDLALRTSVLANLANKVFSKRLGQSGPENLHLLPKNITVVDCDDINFHHDTLKGHSYFVSNNAQPTPVIKHIVKQLA